MSHVGKPDVGLFQDVFEQADTDSAFEKNKERQRFNLVILHILPLALRRPSSLLHRRTGSDLNFVQSLRRTTSDQVENECRGNVACVVPPRYDLGIMLVFPII